MIESLINWLLGLLKTPSGFDSDPWGFLRNQVAHAVVFGVIPVLFGVDWPVVVLAYAFFIEVVQITFFNGEVWDSFEDVGFVTGAALPVSYAIYPAFIVVALFIVAGFLRRKRDRDLIAKP